jgi:hypothetical protein
MTNINFTQNNNYDIVVNEVNNIIPTDEFLEENYVETFSGDLFKNSATANWNTTLKKIVFENDGEQVISNSICKNTTGADNEYKHTILYADGTNLDDITFYIGEDDKSTITYTELPTTGNKTTRQSQRVALTNTNKYGLNWKAVGAEGSEITRLQITYEKE